MWTFTGTLFYCAPESFEIGYTEKVDIWGLGIIAYELATGSLPFLTEYQ
jgi:serine/threonine protein kinase